MQDYDNVKLTFKHHMPLSNAESKTLDTLISIKSGSAYSIQKNSDLKHYSTVLRALKKLEKKGCVKAQTEMIGARGKKSYVPTHLGKLTQYISRDEKNQVFRLFTSSSHKFREMVDSDLKGIEKWTYDIAVGIIWNWNAHIHADSKLRTIDEIVEVQVEDEINEKLLSIQEESVEKIIELTKVKWIKKLAIKLVIDTTDWYKKQIEIYNKLQETLTTE